MVTTAHPGGIGAVGGAASRMFHPGATIRQHFPGDLRHRIEGAVVTGEGMRPVRHKMKLCYLVSIPGIPDREFYIIKRNFKINVAPEVPFDSERRQRAPARPAVVGREDDDRVGLRDVIPNVFGGAEELEALRAEGIEVDDDNEPLPEDAVPAPPDPEGTLYNYEQPTFCPRRVNRIPNDEGRWRDARWDELAAKSEFHLFRMCMPEQFIRDVVLPATNEKLTPHLSISEFYVWIGCNFFMACFQGISDRELWWSSSPVSMFSGAPFRLNEYMSRNRFLEVSAAIVFTGEKAPTLAQDGYDDRFHAVRALIDAFNEHMSESYFPSWLNCLDESMSSWLSKFCPGFMCVPRKPHPFGNEYHTICDGDGGKPILWRVKLVEGKDRPKKADGSWAFPSEFEQLPPTAKTMMAMTKPIHGRGCVVIGDSGFCVKDGVLACHRAGVYFQAYVKKRRAWPKGVPGDHIDAHFDGPDLGYCETLVQEIDGVRFLVHCCRDSKYVSKIMSTHGMLDEIQDHKTWRKMEDGRWRSFNYTEPFSRYSKAKHWVDDHNNRRHDPIGLEEVWGTKWWPMRQFTFLCGVAEVNACQSQARGRRENPVPQLEFRRKLAEQLLNNTLDKPRELPPAVVAARRPGNTEHKLMRRGVNEGSWNASTRRFKRCSVKYVVLRCHGGCGKKIRTYCACDKSTPLCEACWARHRMERE